MPESPAHAPRPASRADSIASQIREEILRGDYQPGDRLPAEREIASRLGVNRTSVREALRKLEEHRLVVIRHGGGATVRPLREASIEVVRHLVFAGGRLDHDVARQLLDVEEMLVAGAARLAVEHGTDAELERARELIGRLASRHIGDDAFLDTMETLVALIAEASTNLVLQLARNAVMPLFAERFRQARKQLRPPHDQLAPVLARIEKALQTRDGAAAEEAVRSLIRSNRPRILAALERAAANRDQPVPALDEKRSI